MNIDQILENAAVSHRLVALEIQGQGFGLDSHSLLLVASVNAGLSLELYAKCLCYLYTGSYPKTHVLSRILASLPPQVQEKLRADFEHGVTDEERVQVQTVQAQSGAEIHIDYDSVVANWSRVFVDGRYWFEQSDTSRTPLHWFFFELLVRVMSDAIAIKRSHATQTTM